MNLGVLAKILIYNAKWFEIIMLIFVVNFAYNIKRYNLLKFNKWPCFESAILSSIHSNLDLSSIVVSSEINDTIFLSLLIDKSGDLSLVDIEKTDNLIPYIPTLELLVRESIQKAPILYPATKTNIGVPVSTKIKLPLIIKSN